MLKKVKTYFREYRPFFLFLFKFFAVYAILTIIYKLYLKQFENLLIFKIDGFTQMVAHQVHQFLMLLDYQSSLTIHSSQPAIKLYLQHVYVARVVEGCNALSVIILFAAFIVAFAGKLKPTILYILCGSLLIHFLNVIRIALLSIALLHYPEQGSLLHGVVFPLFIYGVVFGLWVIWVNKFSNHAAKTSEQ